jgi:hypothetical protein
MDAPGPAAAVARIQVAPRAERAPSAEPTPPAAEKPEGPPADPIRIPPHAKEVVERRTPSSRTFDHGDGTFTTESFTEQIHYWPRPNAPLVPIELGFEALQEPDRTAVSRKAPATVTLPPPRQLPARLPDGPARGREVSLALVDPTRGGGVPPRAPRRSRRV